MVEPKEYPVVTLCGSTRFKDDFLRVQKELTLRGYIVISVVFSATPATAKPWRPAPNRCWTTCTSGRS